jgi:hypothetical protein
MISLSTRCHHCATHLELAESRGDQVVHCPQCLDPTEDAPIEAHLQGRGATPEDALQNWFDRREQLDLEPEHRLSELASFIVPERPEGYVLTVTKWDAVLGKYEITKPTIESALEASEVFGDRIYYGPAAVQKAANQ